MSQGIPKIARSHQRLEEARKDSPLEAPGATWACRHVDFRPLPPEYDRIPVRCCKAPGVWHLQVADFYQKLQKGNPSNNPEERSFQTGRWRKVPWRTAGRQRQGEGSPAGTMAPLATFPSAFPWRIRSVPPRPGAAWPRGGRRHAGATGQVHGHHERPNTARPGGRAPGHQPTRSGQGHLHLRRGTHGACVLPAFSTRARPRDLLWPMGRGERGAWRGRKPFYCFCARGTLGELRASAPREPLS
ncbi:uncharacterized protein LOC122234054 [Panthera tigris]|uniref:uncharacterized protein LOC122234054 n=1 Tax=Panthera tigris TaxID=9694 RepID=UPI001C6FC1BF|nr:uncharacterized protein LOC122234054 [Panthera tigris]XP_042824730.1 uncharacterized protein LOC122234054 [Panthera tigris]